MLLLHSWMKSDAHKNAVLSSVIKIVGLANCNWIHWGYAHIAIKKYFYSHLIKQDAWNSSYVISTHLEHKYSIQWKHMFLCLPFLLWCNHAKYDIHTDIKFGLSEFWCRVFSCLIASRLQMVMLTIMFFGIYAWKKTLISINVVLYLWVQMFMSLTNIE